MGADSGSVLVTGGSGFVGSHLVRRLLERGDEVHATVRSLANAAKVRPLRQMEAEFPGRLHAVRGRPPR